MARLTSAIVCDFAQVREGLLFVSSGGITRLIRQTMPAPLSVCVALCVEIPPDELNLVHEVRVTVRQVAGAETVAEVVGALKADTPTGIEKGESQIVPLALSFGPAAVPDWGAYDVSCSVDGKAGITLTLYAVKARLAP